MDEVMEALEKYQGLVPLVYDVETMGLAEARPQDMQYAVYLKREADKYIDSLKDAKRWRKVSEEKPQDGQEVWAYDSCQKLVIKLEYKVGESGEGFIGSPLIHGFWPCITHWMPYNKPKAPEEK